MENIRRKISQATDRIQHAFAKQPQVAIILGSGLSDFYREIEDRVEIDYRDIPHFPVSTVPGHAGKLVLGSLGKKNLVIMAGRFHYYEGYTLREISLPIRVLGKLGVKTLIVTNAAGGVNLAFSPGNLMIIEDHLNLMNGNPLIGANDDKWEPRFPDMTTTYTPKLRKLCAKVAERLQIPVRQGVYLATTGPTFETPAEIKMMRTLGADAVGMSTVPEVIIARQMGLDILGISCITNMAAGILDQPITHEEVAKTAAKVRGEFVNLLRGIIEAI